MIITGPGRYVTEDGSIVQVTSWDGYRRAYGIDSRGMEISWYIDNGHVRSGLANGNRVTVKLKE